MKTHTLGVPRIRPEVAAKIRYYVYAYVDPRDSEIFYVGKGCRSRALAHLDEEGETAKNQRIREIKDAGLEQRIDILAYGLANEETALRIEAAVIDALWPGKKLTNKVRGCGSLELGREPLSELEFRFAAKPIKVTEPCILIRINQLYRPGMSATALYEATRGVWTCRGKRRARAKFACAVFQGVIREVYAIQEWYPAGTLEYQTRGPEDVTKEGRWEFSGKVDDWLRAKYRGKSVVSYFSKGAQLPFTYVNCDVERSAQ